MTIRLEQPKDRRAVEELVREAKRRENHVYDDVPPAGM